MSATEDGRWQEGDAAAVEGASPAKEETAPAGTPGGDGKESDGRTSPAQEGLEEVNGLESASEVGVSLPEPEGVAPPAAQPEGTLPRPEMARADPSSTFHLVKWVTWKGEKTPLITQSENGPCPLIAIINILLLRWK
ncbi:hypothetical protein chiPu_0027837, partial [Chiloscyllium punctatum]|nr:hypothetical protein [Chiloscyllium punctatum]